MFVICWPPELTSIKSKTFINLSAKYTLTLDIFTSGHDPLWRANHSFIKIFLIHLSFNKMHLGVVAPWKWVHLIFLFPCWDEMDRIFPNKGSWKSATHFQMTFPFVLASLFLWGMICSNVTTNLGRLQQFLWSDERPWIWPCTCNSSHLASSLMDAWKY